MCSTEAMAQNHALEWELAVGCDNQKKEHKKERKEVPSCHRVQSLESCVLSDSFGLCVGVTVLYSVKGSVSATDTINF